MANIWFYNFRKNWVPLIRNGFATVADVAAEWYFYDAVVKNANPKTEKYELYLFIFFIVGATIGGLTVISLFSEGFRKENQPSCFMNYVYRILALEILLGDIPQFILTSLITVALGELTPTAAFNIATSALNFLFDILDMLEVPTKEPIEGGAPAVSGPAIPDGNGEAPATEPSMAVTGVVTA